MCAGAQGVIPCHPHSSSMRVAVPRGVVAFDRPLGALAQLTECRSMYPPGVLKGISVAIGPAYHVTLISSIISSIMCPHGATVRARRRIRPSYDSLRIVHSLWTYAARIALVTTSVTTRCSVVPFRICELVLRQEWFAHFLGNQYIGSRITQNPFFDDLYYSRMVWSNDGAFMTASLSTLCRLGNLYVLVVVCASLCFAEMCFSRLNNNLERRRDKGMKPLVEILTRLIISETVVKVLLDRSSRTKKWEIRR